MTNFVKSADGTQIAYDRLGSGPLVVLVSGMFSHRPEFQDEAEQLATRFTALNYDRRGEARAATPPRMRQNERSRISPRSSKPREDPRWFMAAHLEQV
jgi:hypothetical protein